MELNTEIEKLAGEMARRQRDEEAPLILFLGAACADAADLTPAEEMARTVFEDLSKRDPEVANVLLPKGDHATPEELVTAFENLLGGMTGVQRWQVLRPFYSRTPVPLFYQDLAVLVQAGYFSRILTTNIDTLFEQALNDVGLRRGSGYQVISLATAEPGSSLLTATDVPVTLIKLHGDLGQSDAMITADEIQEALTLQSRRFMKTALHGDLVMVGYKFESKPFENWLLRTMEGALWWVHSTPPNPPPGSHFGEVLGRLIMNQVVGRSGEPEMFFGQLAFRLLRLQVLESISQPWEAYFEDKDLPSEIAGTVTSIPSTELEVEYLQGQQRRLQTYLFNLEQALILSEKNVNLGTQISYQRRRIAELEDQLRTLSSTQPRVIELLNRINEAAQRTDTDSATLSYLQSHVQAAKGELASDQPNQPIISAAIGAVVALAERLGPSVVAPDLGRELASFASTVAGRGV